MICSALEGNLWIQKDAARQLGITCLLFLQQPAEGISVCQTYDLSTGLRPPRQDIVLSYRRGLSSDRHSPLLEVRQEIDAGHLGYGSAACADLVLGGSGFLQFALAVDIEVRIIMAGSLADAHRLSVSLVGVISRPVSCV